MSEPVAVWSGAFTVFGVEIHCHTLSDGRRIVEEESMDRFMKAMGIDDSNDPGDLVDYFRWLNEKPQ